MRGGQGRERSSSVAAVAVNWLAGSKTTEATWLPAAGRKRIALGRLTCRAPRLCPWPSLSLSLIHTHAHTPTVAHLYSLPFPLFLSLAIVKTASHSLHSRSLSLVPPLLSAAACSTRPRARVYTAHRATPTTTGAPR